jgi:hypothetical protein
VSICRQSKHAAGWISIVGPIPAGCGGVALGEVGAGLVGDLLKAGFYYRITVILDDGTTQSVFIGLR